MTTRWNYKKGLHSLGNGAYAWLAPDGTWGWSNAGLIVDGEEALLVDTLFDLAMTDEMLKAMRDAEPHAARDIGTLVNTHANGDHTHGNELVNGAEIIASNASAEEMTEIPPAMLAAMMQATEGNPAPMAKFLKHAFGAFDFNGITLTPPTRTFDKSLQLKVGNKQVHLTELGPAHTRGDIIVHVPEDRTVFTGDILFIDSTPIMWSGPVQNWINACDYIAGLDAETIVPGHGPITDKAGVTAVKGYLEYIRDEARKRYDAGMDSFEAAKDIALGDYESWGDAERIVVNVDRLYGEFSGQPTAPDIQKLFSQMAVIAGY